MASCMPVDMLTHYKSIHSVFLDPFANPRMQEKAEPVLWKCILVGEAKYKVCYLYRLKNLCALHRNIKACLKISG